MPSPPRKYHLLDPINLNPNRRLTYCGRVIGNGHRQIDLGKVLPDPSYMQVNDCRMCMLRHTSRRRRYGP